MYKHTRRKYQGGWWGKLAMVLARYWVGLVWGGVVQTWFEVVLWSRGEREFPFPTIPGNTGLPFPFPKFGNEFFIPVPVPKSWECYFLFPFPKFGNAIFLDRGSAHCEEPKARWTAQEGDEKEGVAADRRDDEAGWLAPEGDGVAERRTQGGDVESHFSLRSRDREAQGRDQTTPALQSLYLYCTLNKNVWGPGKRSTVSCANIFPLCSLCSSIMGFALCCCADKVKWLSAPVILKALI